MDATNLLSFCDFLHRFKMTEVQPVIRQVCGARVVDVKNRAAVDRYSETISYEKQEAIKTTLLNMRTSGHREQPYPMPGPTRAASVAHSVVQTRISLTAAPAGPSIESQPSTSFSPLDGRPRIEPDRSSDSPTRPRDPTTYSSPLHGNHSAEPDNSPNMDSSAPNVGPKYMKTVDHAVIDSSVVEFIERTNNASMRQGVCISCARLLFQSEMESVVVSAIPNRHLLRPVVPHPAHELTDGMLLAGGAQEMDRNVHLCTECVARLKDGRRPKLSLANGMWVGDVPPELQNLTLPERILISLAFPAAHVVKLYPSGRRAPGWQQDRLNSGLRGNVSSYKLDQQQISNMIGVGLTVPPPARILSATLAITYIGSNDLPKQCLPGTFRVRRHRVARALQWLKAHNPLYANVQISSERLNELPTNAVPNEVLQTVRWSTDVEQLELEHETYIPLNEDEEDPMDVDGDEQGQAEDQFPEQEDIDNGNDNPAVIPLQALGVVDIAGHDIPDSELFAHALANTAAASQGSTGHATTTRPAEYAIRHGAFMSEYPRRDPVTGLRFDGGPDDPNHLLAAFPYLFPYGKGGFETDQAASVSYDAHARWAMQYADRRFRKDLLFVFQVFGVIQKRQVCQAATLQIKSMNDSVHEQLRSLTAGDLLKASEEEARKIPFTNPAIRTLRAQMTAIRARVTGTDESRRSIRGKTWGTNLLFNNPALWCTINPSDTHDPLAQVLAGEEIDLDEFYNTAGPDSNRRSVNVANDPFAAAQFFHFFINLVLEALLGIKGSKGVRRIQRREGLFGEVQAYIGTVEAQGRGTLHLHILIWLKDAPSPEATKEALRHTSFRERLRAFIRQNIVGDIDGKSAHEIFVTKTDKEGAYSRPIDPRSDTVEPERKDRTKVLARSLQYHQCRDGGCRVVRKGRVVCKRGAPFTTAKDAWVSDSGQWGPKRLSPYLNAWQPTLLHTLRCNHDLKILTGGEDTQNITWYISNYHSKNQQHSSNVSALLAPRFAYHLVEEQRKPNVVDINKRMLQRCTNALARDREFSAPEVVSYLMGWGDRFESHHYVNIKWDSAMRTLLRAYPGLKEEHDVHQQRYRPSTGVAVGNQESPVGDEPTFVEPEETYTLQFRGEGLDIRNQVKEYAHRGDSLERDSFLQVFLETYDAPYKAPEGDPLALTVISQSPDQTPENEQRHVGRRPNERIPYRPTYGNANRCRIRRSTGHETLPRFSGRWFPRNNNPGTRQLYCASMLLLLKPWRSLKDLKRETESFTTAFERFFAQATEEQKIIMENIQCYYDCADKAQVEVGEEHNSMTYAAPLDEDLRQELEIVRAQDLDPVAGLTEEHVSNARATKISHREQNFAMQAMCVAHATGMTIPGVYDVAEEPVAKICHPEELETVREWEAELKAITREHGQAGLTLCADHTGAEDRAAVLSAVPPPSVAVQMDESPDDMASLQNTTQTPAPLRDLLNLEQRRAHDIMVECLENNANGKPQPQLLMVVHGQGGTGKSMLIGAVTETLKEKGLVNRLGKTATSGIAASPIGGNTVHHFWGLPINISGRDWLSKSSDEVKARRIKNIGGSWMIVTDEMSMLTRATMTNISEVGQVVRMQQASLGCDASLPFGGIHMVLMGDFHQFPPVASDGNALYSERPHTDKERAAFGRELFKQFTTVVILREQKRSHDPGWTDILNRLRVGECTPEDLEEVEKLVLTNPRCEVPNFSSPEWKDVILVTPRHSVRKEWNKMALAKHCQEGAHRRYRIVAKDLDKTTRETPRLDFRVAIAGLPDKKSGKLEQEIDVAKGMKCMVVTNIATEADVANGTRGVVEDIWLHPDEEPFGEDTDDPRLLEDGTYVLTHIPPMILFRPQEKTELRFPGIPPGLVPITPGTTTFKVANGRQEERSIQRRQYAITGAYAFTDYKSQGQTIEKAIIDIRHPLGGKPLTPFNVYVALSRGRGRDSIRILTEFDTNLFTTHPSEELRDEMERLEDLDRTTLARHMSTRLRACNVNRG